MSRDHVREVFPEISEIDHQALRDGVVDAWATAMTENDIDNLRALPWFPPAMPDLGIEDESLVDHVRDVTAGAVGLAETLVEQRGTTIDVDTVIAGALIHDVSKCYEFDGMQETPIGDLLGHPYYGVHVVAAADLPVELAHVVLSHTDRTAVEPATLEAVVVRRADEAAAAVLREDASADSRNA